MCNNLTVLVKGVTWISNIYNYTCCILKDDNEHDYTFNSLTNLLGNGKNVIKDGRLFCLLIENKKVEDLYYQTTISVQVYVSSSSTTLVITSHLSSAIN